MNLRLKLFLPLLVIFMILVAYLFLSWLPGISRYQVETIRQLHERELGALGESLAPMVVAGQLGDIHDTLDALKLQYPEWQTLELLDHRGRRLYPLPGTPEPAVPDPQAELYERQLELGQNRLATLSIRVSYARIFEQLRQSELRLMGLLILVTLGGFLGLALILEFTIRRPLSRLSAASRALAGGQFDFPLPKAGADDMGGLIQSFGHMRQEVRDQKQQLEEEIAERREAQAALENLNANLEQRVREALARDREKDHLLIQQSRLASMGEMVHNIAHQWRQPLNALGLVVRNIQDDYDYGALNKDSLAQSVNDALRLLQRMSDTIDDFRNFFRPDRERVQFDVAKAVQEAIFVMGASLRNYNIDLKTSLPEGILVEGFPAQYSHGVLNVLMNAKEAIQERRVAQGCIQLRLGKEAGLAVLTIDDNGGGMEEKILAQIFDPYFTTKAKGSGIGLYMTKTIIEKNMQGTLRAANIPGGSRFIITVPLAGETVHD